jgi:hypothetical protein
MRKSICVRMSIGAAAGAAAALAFAVPAGAAVTGGAVSPSTGNPITTAAPGDTVRFAVYCAEKANSATLSTGLPGGKVLGSAQSLPMKAGATPGSFGVDYTIPTTVTPGNYTLSANCSDGTGTPIALTIAPVGKIQTGGGATSTGPDTGLIVTGGALAAVAALGGGAALAKRRRSIAGQ